MKIPKGIFITIIKVYQIIFSPQTGWLSFLYGSSLTSISGGSQQGCRYYPTCSEYSKEVINKYPIFTAFKKIISRIKRCHPYSVGGVDLP